VRALRVDRLPHSRVSRRLLALVQEQLGDPVRVDRP
jgi:hypothetical protein